MKPFALPKAFQSLTDEQLNTLNQWLDDPACTYQIIRAKLRELYNLQVSDPTLSRYSRRRVLADQTIDHDDSAHNIRTFLAIQNGHPVPYDQAGLALIQKRAFDAACAPHVPVAKLATLQRIFHYNTARADAQRRLAQADQRLQQVVRRNDLAQSTLQLREQTLALRREESARRAEGNSKLETQNSKLSEQSDHLGPYATNWDEISERARLAFGVSKEDWAHRQTLHETYVDPNLDLNLTSIPFSQSSGAPTPLPQNHNNGGTSSGSPTSISRDAIDNTDAAPADPHLIESSFPACAPGTQGSALSSTVHTYTIRRAQEYWTWRRHIESLPHGESQPNFITQHRHCPCGQVPSGTPCPDHENDTYGQFPDWFWTISPYLHAYAKCLTARNLPYRSPNECIPKEFLL